MGIELIITSILLGAGLAMDAFSVSVADGLSESNMSNGKRFCIAGTFAGFQFAMPMIGWFLVTSVRDKFESFRPFIPWIALILLVMIGAGLIKDGIAEGGGAKEAKKEGANGATLTASALVLQGIATSIDALSVGFTTASYTAPQALLSSVIIGVVTFAICMAGLVFGRRLSDLLGGKSMIAGGAILILIGIEIWVKGVFF